MDKDKLIQQYLDGELGPEEERKALHLIADDPDLRQLLSFERKLRRTFRIDDSATSFSVPAGFTDRVMHNIEQQSKEARSPGFLNSLNQWIEWFLRPRMVQVRPAYLSLLLLLISILMILPRTERQVPEDINMGPAKSVQQVKETDDKVWLRFVFIDNNARTVGVAGDFSNWEPISLSKQMVNGQQVWTGLVAMDRGEHRYMYVKNDTEWVTDPLAPIQREDGFGNKNAVIYL